MGYEKEIKYGAYAKLSKSQRERIVERKARGEKSIVVRIKPGWLSGRVWNEIY